MNFSAVWVQRTFCNSLATLDACLLAVRVKCRTSEETCISCKRVKREARKKDFLDFYDKFKKERLEDRFIFNILFVHRNILHKNDIVLLNRAVLMTLKKRPKQLSSLNLVSFELSYFDKQVLLTLHEHLNKLFRFSALQMTINNCEMKMKC